MSFIGGAEENDILKSYHRGFCVDDNRALPVAVLHMCNSQRR